MTTGSVFRCALLASLLLLLPLSVSASEALFEDVSQKVGLTHTGATYGASWGDLNGDGWPDLWVGNHNEAPSLYLNIGGVSLQDIASRAWTGDATDDAHGAAWADFDNDGDQDLVEVVAATITDGEMCMGCGTNHLYINQSGRLVESAAAYGVDQQGLARAPLWVDADDDGRLDLFISNLRSKDRKLPGSMLLLNKPEGFRKSNRGLHDRKPDRKLNRYEAWAKNLFGGSTKQPGQMLNKTHHGFAQLADLTGDGRLDIVNHSKPVRVFSREKRSFKDVSLQLGFPDFKETGDAALADFDGDGDMDFYLTAGPYRVSQVEQPDEHTLHATLLGHRLKKDPVAGKSVSFSTAGTLTLKLGPEWLSLDKILLGASGKHPVGYTMTFTAAQAQLLGEVDPVRLADGAVGISFDAGTGRWTIANRVRAEFVDVVAVSNAPIERVERFGFKEFIERGRDALLIANDGVFERVKISDPAGAASSCHSVTQGDFDNDMDVDLYLVCSESVRNSADRLLLNDGRGVFTLTAPLAASAPVAAGRGDVAVAADYNRDGFLDLFVANGADPASPFVEAGPHQLLRNRGNQNHYLEIDLQGTVSNRDAIGARVVILAGGTTQVREQNGGMHRFSQDHQRLHFGLADNTVVERIAIRWPSGTTQELRDIAADQVLTVVEPAATAVAQP